ncbi:MAG: GH116 family glycosyl hydrolase [Bacteroidetes bacterium]|nr:GH116 family glycosyl hydrolase [Bacteroidota bacterium]
MKMYKSHSCCFIVFFLLLLVNKSFTQNAGLEIDLLGNRVFNEEDREMKAAFGFLKKQKEYKTYYISAFQVNRNPGVLKNPSVVWFHKNDTNAFSAFLCDPVWISKLKHYVEEGGTLLLTQEACQYLNVLGLEQRPLQVQHRELSDEGYGRKAGMHAFREHPVFSGLYGGAYLQGPDNDTTLRVTGFFKDDLPDKGKVIAVEWAYITLSEDSRLMWEYPLGKGKILCIGAYCLFSPVNNFKDHLERFMGNVFGYLAGKTFTEKPRHWETAEPLLKAVPSNTEPALEIAPSRPWIIDENSPVIRANYAGDDYCEVAGRRMLIMGKEKGGIEEIWTHPVMALRDYRVGIRFYKSREIIWLDEQRPSIETRPESFTRVYKFRRAYLTEIISAGPLTPAGVVHYEYRGINPATLVISFHSNFRLMWPYSERATGTVEYSFDKGLNAFHLRDQRGESSCLLGFNKIPCQEIAGPYKGFTLSDTLFTGDTTNAFLFGGLAQFQLGMNDNLDVVIAAGGSSQAEVTSLYRRMIRDPQMICQAARLHYNKLLDNALVLQSDDKDFTEGYLWSLVATDRFFVNTPGIGLSLVAGYGTTARGWNGNQKVNGRPGYAWYFGRDGEWSGMAVTDYGDFSGVKAILNQYVRYQDLSGKIYHELTTSGVVHYDAADATPLFVVLAGRYVKQSGDTAWLRLNWPAVLKAIDYCYSTDTDGDHLIENTAVGHGWVEGGKLFPVHTEIYLAGCWAEALKSAARMSQILGNTQAEQMYSKEYEIVRSNINKEFWNEKGGGFFFGKLRNGTYNPEPTVLPAVPMLFGLTDSIHTSMVLQTYAANGFTSDWGVRILSEESPLFNPRGYHYGSVWPLFTGWTSLAEYKYQRPVQAYTHLMENLLNYKYWGKGYVEEVLNGAEYKPSGVCPHQCWSETMVLQPAIEGLLGLDADALKNLIRLSPQLPADWKRFQANNIRVGSHHLDLLMEKKGNQVIWTFLHRGETPLSINLSPSYPPGTRIEKSDFYGAGQNIFAQLSRKDGIFDFFCRDTAVVVFTLSHGAEILPVVPDPKPGLASEGLRILDSRLEGNSLLIHLQGRAESQGRFRIFLQDEKPGKVNNARVLYKIGNIYSLETTFPDASSTYVNQTVVIPLAP